MSARKASQAIASPLLWTALLFGAAGRLDWVRGWIGAALYVVSMIAGLLTLRRFNPELIEARANWRRNKGTKTFDKLFLALALPLGLIQAVVAGLDGGRFGWSCMPPALAWFGIALFLLGIAWVLWAVAVNPFAEATVRIQTERGHKVVSSGPYRFIRHPIYAGNFAIYLAMPLILGSIWALAISVVLIGLFIWRTGREDETLRRELPGYAEYARKTRYRLVPGMW